MNLNSILLGVSLSLLFSCTSKKKEQKQEYDFSNMKEYSIPIDDVHSQANYQDVELSHLLWDATVDFDRQVIEATATWIIKQTQPTDFLLLDTKDLQIKSVLLNGSDKTQFELLEENELLGRALKIEIFENTERVSIMYETSPEAEALQWLSPAQTADKQEPFLYTQSQAILARTWLPCMDSPGMRFTYTANVQVPEYLLALMSATNPVSNSDTGMYHFEMEQPIPAYLFALAVGVLEYRKIGENSGVYAEPSLIDKAAKEFSDLPNMIQTAENLYGPYRWGQYDILVLPPSFPFGGMENPRLTFATPTIIAGDKSLTSLIAHELAHSWSGNLVTNATWNDFWLNEGFTVYFEERIMEALYGRDYSEMLASLSYRGLQSELKELPKADTHLYLHLAGRNPDDGLTAVAYDKGYLFLRNIEEQIGREHFDAFLKSYFSTYGFKVMDTEHFIDLLNREIIKKDIYLSDKINSKAWVYGPGLPKNHPVPSSNKFRQIDRVIEEDDASQLKEVSKEWTSQEWQYFIQSLPRDLGTDKMAYYDSLFHFTNSNNSEIQFDWYKLAILNQYQAAYPSIEEFLIRVGRRKFLTPLYKAMIDSGQQDFAKEIYAQARPNYHSVSRNTLDELIGKPKAKKTSI